MSLRAAFFAVHGSKPKRPPIPLGSRSRLHAARAPTSGPRRCGGPREKLRQAVVRIKVERPRGVHQLDEADVNEQLAQSPFASCDLRLELLGARPADRVQEFSAGRTQPALDALPLLRGQRRAICLDQNFRVLVRRDRRFDFGGDHDLDLVLRDRLAGRSSHSRKRAIASAAAAGTASRVSARAEQPGNS